MWSRQDELNFFNDAINISSIENLMMRVRGRYYAFQPKTDNSRVNVPNSRNALIGTNTEKWCKDLFSQIARHNNFMGSGTTAVVALKNKRRFVGYDISEEYIKIANNRIANVGQLL